MTSVQSLFACAAADVTLDRVRQLVDQDPPESLTLEFKEKFSSSLVNGVAAMANSYGGIILVGVTDRRELLGVPESALAQVVNACYQLEPPWAPEIIPVRLDEPGQYVLLIRVDPKVAPRPLLVKGAAPVRLHGRNAVADRTRLGRLFAESQVGAVMGSRAIQAPQLQRHSGTEPAPDFVVRSGLVLPVDDAATWRPLSERSIDALTAALETAALAAELTRWCGHFGLNNINRFDRRGFNRARHARLSWQGLPDQVGLRPIEVIVTAALPETYGQSASQLVFTVDIFVAKNAYLQQENPEIRMWRLAVSDLCSLIESLVLTLTSSTVVEALAELAGVDPIVVAQPANLHFVSGPDVADLLQPDGLRPILDAGTSYGADLLADPAMDLRDENERRMQIDAWLQQIGLDAGLRGMEQLLVQLHSASPALTA